MGSQLTSVKALMLVAAASSLLAMAGVTSAAVIASDNAAGYTGAITTGLNSGTGFGPWSVSTGGGAAGTFLASGTQGANIATNSQSWGVYANTPSNGGTPRVDLTRAFNSALTAGDSLSVAMQTDGVGNSGDFGFSLQTSNPINQFTFAYDGTQGYNNVSIADGSHGGAEYQAPSPGINFTDINNGIIVTFTLVTANSYDLTVSPAGSNNNFSTVNLITNGTLSGGTISQVDLFDVNTSGNGYFNSLAVSNVPEPASLAMFGAGALGLLGLARRRQRV
ncbi:MAG: PEP-CTERM sorting domain-containing protein [Phycisphaerales bacterium]|nr:PEP-CTERM sorting domain-containing protein [Phycisphaerales bacterium]